MEKLIIHTVHIRTKHKLQDLCEILKPLLGLPDCKYILKFNTFLILRIISLLLKVKQAAVICGKINKYCYNGHEMPYESSKHVYERNKNKELQRRKKY